MNAPMPASALGERFELLVRQIRMEARNIHAFELSDPDGRELPPFTAGAHIDVHIAPGLIRQYSLCNDPAERHRYVIAVLRDDNGRGGSKTAHERISVGQRLTVSAPRNHFELAESGRKSILIAGGIGITPLKAMAHQLERLGLNFELHYCARGPEAAAFQEDFATWDETGRVRYHFDGGEPGKGLDLNALLATPDADTHVYYCGPAGFMSACERAAAHWPVGTVHCEHFKAPEKPVAIPAAEGACVVKIASTGQELTLAAEDNLAEVLHAAGLPVETSCQSGLCGTCKIGYRSGEVDHQDYILSDDERQSCLTPCVSRPRSGTLVLDL